MSFDDQRVYFHARTREAFSNPAGTNWMLLFLDLDGSTSTGWLSYDFVLNRAGPGSIERHAGNGFAWITVGSAQWRVAGDGLELSVPWPLLGLNAPPKQFDFKWADNCIAVGDWTDFTLNGDAAPNDRFNYRAVLRF